MILKIHHLELHTMTLLPKSGHSMTYASTTSNICTNCQKTSVQMKDVTCGKVAFQVLEPKETCKISHQFFPNYIFFKCIIQHSEKGLQSISLTSVQTNKWIPLILISAMQIMNYNLKGNISSKEFQRKKARVAFPSCAKCTLEAKETGLSENRKNTFCCDKYLINVYHCMYSSFPYRRKLL